MTHQAHMQRAVDIARRSKQDGGAAIGAVLVHNTTGEIVATGESLVRHTMDPSAHAETNCIRQACSQLQSLDLGDYSLYCTLEPCHMCLSCAAWAGLPAIYFGAYREDVDGALFEVGGDYSAEKLAANMQLPSGRTMTVTGGVLRQECASLLRS